MPFRYARMVAVDGIEPSRPERLVYSQPPIHTGLHRRTGARDGTRTHTAPALNRRPLPRLGYARKLVGRVRFELTRGGF